MNKSPEYCPYCGAEVEAVREPMIHRFGECDDYVFDNPTPGGSARTASIGY